MSVGEHGASEKDPFVVIPSNGGWPTVEDIYEDDYNALTVQIYLVASTVMLDKPFRKMRPLSGIRLKNDPTDKDQRVRPLIMLKYDQ